MGGTKREWAKIGGRQKGFCEDEDGSTLAGGARHGTTDQVSVGSTENLAPQTRIAISNSAGVVSNTITLADSFGNRSVVHPANGFTWLTEYDLGLWSIAIPYAVYGEVGVGGPHVPGVNLGHICRQTLQ